MKIKLVNSLLVVAVASLFFCSCTVFAKETQAKKTPSSKIAIKIPKNKSFTEQYKVILKKLKENSPIKDSFESAKEYEDRRANNNLDVNLTFVEYFDIELKYDPEERILVYAYTNSLYETNYMNGSYVNGSYVFANCITDLSMPSTIMNVTGVRNCFNIKSKSELFDKNGFKRYLFSKMTKEYVATNGFGNEVNVKAYFGESIYLVPNNDLAYQQVQNIKIKADSKEYAKANINAKLKIIGEIIEPSLIEYGFYQLKATFNSPNEYTGTVYGAYVKIHSMIIVDSNGKEWVITGSQSE